MTETGGFPQLKNVFTEICRLVFPPACMLCKYNLPHTWRHFFCEQCLQGIVRLPALHCPQCLLPYAGSEGISHLCGRCLSSFPAFQRTIAVGLYEQSLQSAVYQFKFQKRISLDRPLAGLLHESIPSAVDYDLIVPVPMHPVHLKQRSFNQAFLLARELGRLRKEPVAVRLLVKERLTSFQHNLSARQREENLRGAFIVTEKIRDKRVLLIDDVMTTAATAAQCSRTLVQAGALSVDVAVVARAA